MSPLAVRARRGARIARRAANPHALARAQCLWCGSRTKGSTGVQSSRLSKVRACSVPAGCRSRGIFAHAQFAPRTAAPPAAADAAAAAAPVDSGAVPMAPAPAALVAGVGARGRQPSIRDLTLAGGLVANPAVVQRSRRSIGDLPRVAVQQLVTLNCCSLRCLQNMPCDNVERIRAELAAATSLDAQSGVIAGLLTEKLFGRRQQVCYPALRLLLGTGSTRIAAIWSFSRAHHFPLVPPRNALQERAPANKWPDAVHEQVVSFLWEHTYTVPNKVGLRWSMDVNGKKTAYTLSVLLSPAPTACRLLTVTRPLADMPASLSTDVRRLSHSRRFATGWRSFVRITTTAC